jgi:hypothetical protein
MRKAEAVKPRLFKILYVFKGYTVKAVIVPRSSHKQYSIKYADLQPPYSYTPIKIASLEKTISPARLSTYQIASGGNKVDAIRLYHWNIALLNIIAILMWCMVIDRKK